ncbi:MAG: flagellar hook-associated protein FlgK [Desulfobacterales bacterium]|nr:flagellar hook-associated protein FlgK [Desulfobacterales bacterium]
MSGITALMNLSQNALNTAQIGINVCGQNIANVDTVSYSRQSPYISTSASVSYGGVLLGTGASVEEIVRSSNQYIEEQLMNETSTYAGLQEYVSYMERVESIFNENSDNALSSLISDFYSAWQDLSNNPSGAAERVVVYELGDSISDRFNALNEDLRQIEDDLSSEIETALSEINNITANIASINKEIVALEAGGSTANDQRDNLNQLLTNLSELIDINTFENSNGAITVSTAKGYTLVNSNTNTELGMSGDLIVWEGSSGDVDITDDITGGKVGGWLMMRDEAVPTYMAELDVMAEGFIWAVNYEHSQGAGLEYFDGQISGTYQTGSSELLSTLSYADKLDFSNNVVMWLQDSSTEPPTSTKIEIDLSAAAPVTSSDITLSGNANSVLDSYVFTVDPAGSQVGGGTDVTINWSNNLTEGSFTVDAGSIPETIEVDGMKITFDNITGPFTNDTFVITTDANGNPTENISGYTLTDFADEFNNTVALTGGGVTASVVNNAIVFTPDSDNYSFAFSDDESEESGMMAALGINTFFSGDSAMTMEVNDVLENKNLIAACSVNSDTGEIGAGDNTNALAIIDSQNLTLEMRDIVLNRGEAASSSTLNSTIEGYYQVIISKIGLSSLSIKSSMEFSESMVATLTGQRDAVSAVSLDEEMVNLMQFQSAYSAAAKLLTVADEMLQTLLSVR